MYLSYIIGIIVGPPTGKLIDQIGNGAIKALVGVAFDFNIESLAPPHSGIFDIPLYHGGLHHTP